MFAILVNCKRLVLYGKSKIHRQDDSRINIQWQEIYFENLKHKKSWIGLGVSSAPTAKPNHFGRKVMLCVWWDQRNVVCCELLKPRETVNTKRYQQQLANLNRSPLERRPEYWKRQRRVIFLHENVPSHTEKPEPIRYTSEALSWEVLPHAGYSPGLAPFDYHFFASRGHALAEQRFGPYEDVKKWLDDRFAAKGEDFYWRGIHKSPVIWKTCITSDGAHFE